MKKGLVHLSDDALPAALFARLRKAVVGLGEQRLQRTYQTTFWFDFAEPASNVVEEAITKVRARTVSPVHPESSRGTGWPRLGRPSTALGMNGIQSIKP